jgi:hypothetical protein
MRTTYISNTLYRATISEDSLFIFDDVKDQLILTISSIVPSKEEMEVRNFDSVEEFFKVEIQRIVAEELELPYINLSHLFTA